MSKFSSATLTEEEIEEELVNNDLLNSGGVEDQASLEQMDLQEKKSLLRGIQQSKEDYKTESSTSSTIIINTSSSDFPPLAAAAKNNSRNKLKLIRKQSFGTKQADSDASSDKCISVSDDDELFAQEKKFSLPFYISDNAPPLIMRERPTRPNTCPYYQLKGELPMEALKRIIAQHDAWKAKYDALISKLESQALVGNLEDFDNKETLSEKNGDQEDSPYQFPDSPVRSSASHPKVYGNAKKKETNKNSEVVSTPNNRTLQRKTSRDSDCEDVTPILKAEDPKLGEWLSVPRPRNKRNRKQISGQEKNKTYESQPEVEFDFGSNRSLWPGGSGARPQSPSSSSVNNKTSSRRSLPMPNVLEVEEEKVQCPICQKNFTLSTVENHAATCEGFSGSPMDVEEGT